MTDKQAPTQQSAPDPSLLMQLSTAYWGSQTLLTANRLGLFSLLKDGPRGSDQLAADLDFQPRHLLLFLRACVGLGLLVETSPGQFGNSPLSAAFLVPGQPGFMGNAISYSDDLYETWGKLGSTLESGTPPMKTDTYTGDDEERTRHFVYGMHDRALGIGHAMAGLVDLQGRTRMLDVGGGPGTYSSLFAQRNPGLHSTVMDLPGVVAIAREIIASLGVGDRVDTFAGDYLNDPWPDGNDVVLISGVFHRESEQGCRALIASASAALEPGGLLIVSDVFTDAGNASPLFATLFGLNMMLTAPNGGVHADADVGQWMTDEGFGDIQYSPFPPPMPHRIVMGIKA